MKEIILYPVQYIKIAEIVNTKHSQHESNGKKSELFIDLVKNSLTTETIVM